MLIDTGGVDLADRDHITSQIAVQAQAAIDDADLVLFVVDARAGITPGDEELAELLRRSKKPVLLLANKIDDPAQESLALDLHRLGLGDPIPISGLHGTQHRRPARRDRRPAPRQLAAAGRRRGDSRRDPRPAERRQVLALQPARRRGADDRLRDPGDDPRLDRHGDRARRPHLRARRHGRAAPQAPAAAGHRVLLGAARARGGRARRRGARPDRRQRGHRRGRHHRGRGGAQGALLDADRALEVGRRHDHDRGGAAGARSGGCASGRRSSPSRRTAAAASRACSTASPSCSTST